MFGVIKSITTCTFANRLIKNLAVLFITTIVCYSDLDWNDEKYFPHGKEDDEEDGDDDDYYEDEEDEEDENDEEDDNNPLTNPLKKSSDPFIRFRKIFRRFRRRIFGR